ncbi:MAG: phosphohistidine phosphatase SixA [Archaeoglobaceae archaeon]
MKVYLVQHAEPKPKDEDPERPLSEKGEDDLKKMTSFLKGKGIRVGKILHSGKLRARQTAEIFSGVIDSGGVEEVEGLKAKDDPEFWGSKLKTGNEDVMLVGHLPHMGKLAGLLVADDSESNVINFQMGGVVCLTNENEEGSWSVHWMVTPQLLE